MAAVSSLPQLRERKAIIDKHTNMLTAILNAIKARIHRSLCLYALETCASAHMYAQGNRNREISCQSIVVSMQVPIQFSVPSSLSDEFHSQSMQARGLDELYHLEEECLSRKATLQRVSQVVQVLG